MPSISSNWLQQTSPLSNRFLPSVTGQVIFAFGHGESNSFGIYQRHWTVSHASSPISKNGSAQNMINALVSARSICFQ